MVIPLGKSVLQFPTLAYLPQYLSFFVVGIVASRRYWLRALPGSLGAAGLLTALAAMLLLFPLAFSGQWFSLALGETMDKAMGNGHWQSAVYALWDSAFAAGMCLGLITLFRRFINGQSRFGRFLAQHSYAVYVFHIPIIVFMVYALRGIALGSLLKFCLATFVIVPACFAAAYLVRRIPLASKVF